MQVTKFKIIYQFFKLKIDHIYTLNLPSTHLKKKEAQQLRLIKYPYRPGQ